jgi:hypothetical protein
MLYRYLVCHNPIDLSCSSTSKSEMEEKSLDLFKFSFILGEAWFVFCGVFLQNSWFMFLMLTSIL